MIVHEIADRAKVVADWFGALPVDEYPIYEQPLTRRLQDDRNEAARAFGRFEKVFWVVAFAVISSIFVAQIHEWVSRPPAPVVGSYYLEHDGSGK